MRAHTHTPGRRPDPRVGVEVPAQHGGRSGPRVPRDAADVRSAPAPRSARDPSRGRWICAPSESRDAVCIAKARASARGVLLARPGGPARAGPVAGES